MMKLRIKQQVAKDKIKKSIRNGHKKICMTANPRWGKTVWMADLTKGALAKNKRVWILVHTQELLDQTRATLHKFGIESSAIMGRHPDQNYSMPVQVVMNQTITKRFSPYFDMNPEHLPDICFIDECDVQFKARDELAGMKPNCLFIGVTGTPTAKGMGKFYSDLVIGSTVQESLDEGNLVPIRPFSCYSPDLKGLKTNAKGDYSETDLEQRMNTKTIRGSIVKNWLRLGEDRKTIVYAINCAHARDIANEFDDAGIVSALITGDMNKDMRKQWIKEFQESEIKVLVSVMTLTRGFDCIDIGALILARSTKSLGFYIQMVMRGMTQNDTYDDCIVLDHSDNVARLGWPDEFIVTELCQGVKGENKDRKLPEEPLPKKCHECGYLKPPKTPLCPNCKHEAEPQAGIVQEEGDLIALKKQVTSTQLKHIKNLDADAQQAFYSGMLQHQIDKGYRDGYAFYKFREYFGVDVPAKFHDNPMPKNIIVEKYIKYLNIKGSYARRRRG